MEGVEIKVKDSKKGRGLYSNQHYKVGDVILEEAPLVSCQFAWNELYQYTACENCLRSLETAEAMAQRLTSNPALVLPFPECCEVKQDLIVHCPNCQVSYCGTACRDRAWASHHKALCLGRDRENPEHPLNKLHDTWRNIHFPPETASVMLLLKMIAMVKQAEDSVSVLSEFSQFVQATVNEEEHAVHKLLGSQFQDQLEMLRHMVSDTFYDEKVQQWLTPEGFRSMFALMGTNQQGIGSSSISVWVKNCDALELGEGEREQLDAFIDQLYKDLDKVSGTFLNCEGVGLYSMQSACNHSCRPNAEIEFNNQNYVLSLVAVEDISPEEEICISYLDECDKERSRHSRQKMLRENYLFMCGCPKCLEQADDPDVTSEEDSDEEEEEEEEEDMNDIY
ncbi:histone-lysine N-trimethyltransferase SMYD5-like isoform X2 [Dreissena polymorpha]|uniref:Protein-lysine N-trimethyltransferase SMYD5 n=1 Tax=Dreissena polymorpha TaxID=45954 RepID=A0A9D4IWP5_DREPO|nr:histone-lysine N-trimethyltransferase SMYD5-like isoform X2 [Dreissena polymorpha]KAH3787594.1 hypothetical protein DPMN_165720 [Dreissena polymorpha]